MANHKAEVELFVPKSREVVGVDLSPLSSSDGHHRFMVTVKISEDWHWPEWLMAKYIVMDQYGNWWCSKAKPVLYESGWDGDMHILHDPSCSWFIKFDPPPAPDDWKNSLMVNPNA